LVGLSFGIGIGIGMSPVKLLPTHTGFSQYLESNQTEERLVDLQYQPECPFSTATASLSFVTSCKFTLPRTITTALPHTINTALPRTTAPPLTGQSGCLQRLKF